MDEKYGRNTDNTINQQLEDTTDVQYKSSASAMPILTVNESCEPSENVIRIFKKNQNKKEWRMHRQQLTDQDVKFIAQELKTNKICESINFSFNTITADGVKYLADMLEVNKTLKYFWLACNQIADKGATMLCSILKNHPTLHSLDLSSNEITDQSVDILLEMMEVNSTFKLLFIDVNQISDQNRARLREMAKEQNISLGDLF